MDPRQYAAATRGMDQTSESVRRGLIGERTQACLLDALNSGLTPEKCLEESLDTMKREDFFIYERLEDNGNSMAPQYTDACEVYTGPSSQGHLEFQKCKGETATEQQQQCNIPSFVWSGRSSNKVPVANYHAYVDSDPVSTAIKIHTQTSKDMLDVIRQVNNSFSGSELQAMLFSAEGDALHQLIDCMFMGPFASMDYGSRGLRKDLPVPWYSRRSADAGASDSRDFELPCDASKLDGDMKPPFTCGSPMRRALIKYFVRNYTVTNEKKCSDIPGQEGVMNKTAADVNVQRVVNLVKAKLADLAKVWDVEQVQFGCRKRTEEGEYTEERGPQYCTEQDADEWTPIQLRGWAHVESVAVAQEVFASASCFYERVMGDPKIMYAHLPAGWSVCILGGWPTLFNA